MWGGTAFLISPQGEGGAYVDGVWGDGRNPDDEFFMRWKRVPSGFTLAFAVACFGSASYGFLAGTWPFGVVESVWGVIAWRKWYILRQSVSQSPQDVQPG